MSQKHFQAIWQARHFNGDNKLKNHSSTPAVSNLEDGGELTPQPLLLAGSLAMHVKITISGTPNRPNCCEISTVWYYLQMWPRVGQPRLFKIPPVHEHLRQKLRMLYSPRHALG